MPKGSILEDSFEQLVELGQSTVKQGVKQLGQTFSPLKLLEKAFGKDETDSPTGEKETKKPENSNTPLDLEKLQKKYQEQDKIKEQGLRNRLFQLWRNEEEKLEQRKKMEKQEKERKEAQEKEMKKRREAQENAQPVELPRGKQRRSIFSPKKVAQRQQAEVKPSAGKQ